MIKSYQWKLVVGIIVTGGCLLAACRGRPAQTPPPAPTPLPTSSPTPKPTPTPTLEPTETLQPAIQYLVDVEDAMLKVESDGRFFSPKFGKTSANPGRGSGFIIDPSGLAITSNHAVAGADEIKVWLGNDRSHPYAAELVASSECYDLALIDLEGQDFPYLGWSDVSPEEGHKVYAAGYPLSGRQFLLNGGDITNVPSADNGGSAVPPVIRYDAETSPGMEGGPVLTPEGKVAGVHYAAGSDGSPAYGLELEALRSAFDQLAEGKNVEWIGINGQPVTSDDGTLMGMWVFAVQPESPAQEGGIMPGDLITFIGNQTLFGDTILNQYCQELRDWESQGDARQPIDLQVYRQAGDTLLEGELGGKPLEVVTTAALGIQPTPAEGTPSVANLNASKPGDVFLNENFGAALSNWGRLVLQGDESKVKAELSDNNLLLTLDEVFTYVYYLFKPLKTTDVRLDLSTENLGRNNNNISLICRYSVERGWYEFNIASNGLWWVKRYDPRINNFIDIGKGASKLINLGQAANDYSAVCKDNKLTLYINGKQAAELTDNNLATGQIGFSVSSFNVTPVTVKIDQFKASVP